MTGKEWRAMDETAAIAWYQKAAKAERTDDLDVDDSPAVSMGDECGAYVAAWVWVRQPKCSECLEFVGECVCGEPSE